MSDSFVTTFWIFAVDVINKVLIGTYLFYVVKLFIEHYVKLDI